LASSHSDDTSSVRCAGPMGSSQSVERFKSRFVKHRGGGADEESDSESEDVENHHDNHKMAGSFKHGLECPDGHPMRARVPKEMFNSCYSHVQCDDCEEICDGKASHYQCKECDYVLCNDCARNCLGLPKRTERGPPLAIQTGDIFLAGPDKFGIHHVILVKSGWQEVDQEIFELLDVPPQSEVLCCDTIESTQGSVGKETWWYPTKTYFVRDKTNGVLLLVADLPPGGEVLEQAIDPVPTKILLSPFRPQNGGPELDEAAFLEVIDKAASKSVRYGKRTAVRSVITGIFHMESIHSENYSTPEMREELLDRIKKSWKERPICATVAVQCWQRYLLKTSDDNEEALQQIVRYMPHWCHKSTPSALVKSLTTTGWVLSDTADGEHQ